MRQGARVAEPLRAVIYVPPDVNAEKWQRACLAHCARKGYAVVSLVIDDRKMTRWPDVMRLLPDSADVIVVADMAALPRDRVPRVEEPPSEDSRGIAIPLMRRPRRFKSRE
jgi:hypothetical protein